MPLEHALLGLLMERPGYASEVVRRIRTRVVGWEPSKTAILHALSSLRRSGLVRSRERDAAADCDRPPDVWYEPTVDGCRRLHAWMADSPDGLLSHDELRVRFAFAQPQHLPALHDVLRDQQRLCVDRLHAVADAATAVPRPRPEAWRRDLDLLASSVEAAGLRATMTILQNGVDTIEALLGLPSAGARLTHRG
jgi:DNA-binding PadR family transcriptional regulator